MPNRDSSSAGTQTVLVKLRPSNALKAADFRVNLRPLYDAPKGGATLGIGAEPQWFLAELTEGGATPWDLAHARIADQLGVDESDVIFAEPDHVHSEFTDANEQPTEEGLAVGEKCQAIPQDGGHGKVLGPDVLAWHLGDDFTQLAKARDSIAFKDPRTRIAHLDTGYFRAHVTAPIHVLRELERSFVDKDVDRNSSEDPDNRLLLLDNSGHGTGTISVLAGGKFNGVFLGGAYDADVLPLRIADSVVLLRTSAFARGLAYATDQRCDVVTMSMGGLPSRAWREAVDRAYLEGVCVVAAAGNNFNGLPTRHIVYPARYGRVIAVCGVMANGEPYGGLEGMGTMEGNYGPDSKMRAAIATFTPNIPWAVFGCADVVRLNGEGTSAATPQVAAAAALWIEKYKSVLPRDWRRVEAVRHALFTSARYNEAQKKKLGYGVLKAFDALGVMPRLDLKQTKSDSDSFAFLRVITGLGIVDAPPREEMFNLELTQRYLVNRELQGIVSDPDAIAQLDAATLKKFMEAVIGDRGASDALRKHVAARYPVAMGAPVPRTVANDDVVAKALPAVEVQPALRTPPYRRLRVYATDPSQSTRLETAGVNEVTLKVRWEALRQRGPVGEYLRVVDVDAAEKKYEPVDLNDPRLLAQDGWAPSEGNAQFHQQMVYAVAMKTIEHFERALGRPVLWRPAPDALKPFDDSRFVRQLLVRPHALRQANAFYSPQEVALKFGYFEADASDPGDHVPGSRVYACLSHDIIAHETTHAILDGMHHRFNEASNPDVLAFHEAFADIVALLQHFTIPEVLESEIGRVRGNIEAESMLGSLAVQFGHATGGRGALRDAIGKREGGVWKRFVPDPADLQKRLTPHARGAVLVAAVFDAFVAIYNTRIADLLRIYTGGTGVLPNGSIHPDLVRRLADEATKSANHVLNMCIRAIDYLPPVDVTFFEYLRALITADFDMVSDDRLNYRVAFVEAFRRRGIYPRALAEPTSNSLRTLAVDTLRWTGFDFWQLTGKMRAKIETRLEGIVERLKEFANSTLYVKDRRKLFRATRAQRRALHRELSAAFRALPDFAGQLGLDPALTFEVHELRGVIRVGPDGRQIPQVVVGLTQSRQVEAEPDGAPAHTMRGGSTLVVDLSIPEIKYRIYKDIRSEARRERTAAFARETAADPLRALFFTPGHSEPFAVLHALADDGF